MYDWKCYNYIAFIILSFLLTKIFRDPDFVLQMFVLQMLLHFYRLFLKCFISFLKSNSITFYFLQLLRKKICQGRTEHSLNKLRKIHTNVNMLGIYFWWGELFLFLKVKKITQIEAKKKIFIEPSNWCLFG